MASIPLYLKLWLAIVTLHVVAKENTVFVGGLYFTSEPQDVVGVKGGELVLNCTAASPSGSPVNITWLKDGQEVNDARRYVLRNGSLYFKRVVDRKTRGRTDRSDEGHYECLARDRNGTIISRKAKLTCASITRVSGVELSVVAIEGEVVRLQCPINALPTPTFTWLRDRQTLPLNTGRYIMLPSGVLQIVGVLPSDAGKYRCVGSNLAGTRRSKEFDVSVVDRDESTSSSEMLASVQYLSNNVGETALLECAASGYPQPQISWTHNGDDVVSGGRVKLTGQGNIELRNVQLSDAGPYTCTARPAGSQRPLTLTSTLKVTEKPVLVTPPEREKVMTVAQTVRLACDFEAFPSPQVSWLKNGRPIVHNGRIKMKGLELLIAQSDTSDSGYYQCRAENEAGMAQATIHLYITPSDHAPPPPSRMKAVALGPNSIRLSWDESPPKNGRRILAYSVHYLPTNGGTELQKVMEGTQVDIDQLTAYTNYTFYVVAYNNESASIHSPSVTQMTSEDVPLAAPSVSVTSLGSASMKVEWEPLTHEDSRGMITKYQVIYRKSGQPSQRVEEVPGSTLEYIITGMETHTKYEVRVIAGTNAGYPDLDDSEWPWATGTTSIGDVLLAPETPVLHIVNTTATTIHLKWDPINHNQVPIVGYKIFIHKPPDISGKRMVIRVADTREHIFTALDLNTWYEVSLLAFNENAQSEPVVKTAHTKPGDGVVVKQDNTSPPPPPRKVDAKPVNDSTITVHWPKVNFSQPIRYYTVRYKLVRKDALSLLTGSNAEEQYVETETPEAVITDLKPFKLYEFDVKAHTDSAEGPYSTVVQCKTLEGRPSEPENVHFFLVAPGAVELRWQEPREKNGVIVSYLVKYSTSPVQPDMDWPVKKENGTSTTSRVDDLKQNVVYYFKIQAATKAGEGPATSIVKVRTHHAGPKPVAEPTPPPMGQNDKEMGIIVGVSIGGICIVISLLIILCRNRCSPRGTPAESTEEAPVRRFNGNGYIPNSNGNAYMANSTLGSVRLSSEFHEMDSMQPMITGLNDSDHLDTKGGYDYIISPERNGVVAPVNGLRVNLKPNGQVTTFIAKPPQLPHQCTTSDSEDNPQVPLRSSSLPANQQEEHERLVNGDSGSIPAVPAHHLDSLEDIDHSENSADEYRPAINPHTQPNSDTVVGAVPAVPGRGQPSLPNHTHQSDSYSRMGHHPTSHNTGSNNRGGVAGESTQLGYRPTATAAGSSTDIMQRSGDRGDASRNHVSQPATGHSAHHQQPPRHAPTTSPSSASQQHFRESGITHELGAPARSVQEEVPSSHTSQSRSQGQVNALSATSLHNSPPPPQDQVTFSPTANHMHTDEQVLNQQL